MSVHGRLRQEEYPNFKANLGYSEKLSGKKSKTKKIVKTITTYLNPQHLEQCVSHSKCLVNTWSMKKFTSQISMFYNHSQFKDEKIQNMRSSYWPKAMILRS